MNYSEEAHTLMSSLMKLPQLSPPFPIETSFSSPSIFFVE
jgi:hypothetical protein